MEVPLGFDFSLYARNQTLGEKVTPPSMTKTGTTIAAAVFDGGVVLAGDSRATNGDIVSVKDCMKLHYITDTIYACGAGTAADTDQIGYLVSSKLRLFQLNTGIQPRVEQAAAIMGKRLFKYGGYIQAAMIIGGVDFKGPAVYTLYPNGSVSRSAFTTMGSGSYHAVSVLENGWRPKMTEEECKELVADAIESGITHDLYSGSNINLCVIKANGHEFHNNYRETNKRDFRAPHPIGLLTRD